jgi:hypothetical protein
MIDEKIKRTFELAASAEKLIPLLPPSPVDRRFLDELNKTAPTERTHSMLMKEQFNTPAAKAKRNNSDLEQLESSKKTKNATATNTTTPKKRGRPKKLPEKTTAKKSETVNQLNKFYNLE